MKIQKFLDANPLTNVCLVAQKIERSVRGDLQEHGLSLMAALILVSIFFEDSKQANPGELARTFAMTKSNMSHTLSRLEERGDISRRVTKSDLRSQPVKLTANGQKLCLTLIKYFNKMQATIERAHASEAEALRLSKSIQRLSDLI